MIASEPSAKVILDSISETGSRLTTLEVVMHRFVLAEFNTHRRFSRNSASSRAIPVEKRIFAVEHDTAYPVEWGANQRGMQAREQLSPNDAAIAERIWTNAAADAVEHARALMELGVHKQIANRLLEPFLWHTVVVTSTEWENFFAQRCSPEAQPDIRAAAEAMRLAYNASTPTLVPNGSWHRPYLDQTTIDEVLAFEPDGEDKLTKISVARCARVSYLTHDGQRDYSSDLSLYERLVTARPMHASPLEHVATPGRGTRNFEGWVQLREVVEHETQP